MFDVLIRGGRVVDGTGTPWFRADVGIEGDRIAAVRADLSSADAGWVVDATGLVVAPRAELARLGLTLEWDSLDGYFRRLERTGGGNNIASYISYATIRKGTIGDTDRHPELAELDVMKGLLAEGMQDGGLGLVANLYNSDAIYSTTDELVELCRVAAQ